MLRNADDDDYNNSNTNNIKLVWPTCAVGAHSLRGRDVFIPIAYLSHTPVIDGSETPGG